MRHSDAPKSKLLGWIRFSEEEARLFRPQLIESWRWFVELMDKTELKTLELRPNHKFKKAS